jgi:hypothetical protein
VTSAHPTNSNIPDNLEPEAKDILTRSAIFKDPNRLNIFMFVLNDEGQVVHEFHGVPGGRADGKPAPGRSDYQAEIKKALAKLKLPEEKEDDRAQPVKLPDLKAAPEGAAPAGVRIFVRQDDAGNSHRSGVPVVEVVRMKAEEWQPLAYSAQAKEIDAEALKSWLVWLYPAGVRAADEGKRFQKFNGTLKLEPAGADAKQRHMLLTGDIKLAKGDDKESTFEGKLQIVLSYGANGAEVRSLKGVVEGTYFYRLGRESTQEKLKVALESRPE